MGSWLVQASTISLSISSLTLQAAPPAWWYSTEQPVLNAGEQNSHGIANRGQAKWLAQSAVAALGGALGENSLDLQAVRTELFKPSEGASTGVFYPVRPSSPSAEWLAEQRAPLLIGELKAMAAPFYKKLSVIDADWLENQLKGNGLILGQGYFEDTDGTFYPWDPADNANTEKNHSAATIGQLKLAFSLRFESLVITAPNSDADNDGLTYAQELALGTDPNKKDTDGDRIADALEVEWDLDPTDPTDASKDYDGDLVSNAREIEVGTSPTGLFRVEILPLSAGTNESLGRVGDDGSLVLQRNGAVKDFDNSTIASSGRISDLLGPDRTPLARTRTEIPWGNWQIGGSVPEEGVTRTFASGNTVRLLQSYREFNPLTLVDTVRDLTVVQRGTNGANHTAKSWAAIKSDLYSQGLIASTAVPAPEILFTSEKGTKWVIQPGSRLLVMDETGACVGELPTSHPTTSSSIQWVAINDDGMAVGKDAGANQVVYWTGGSINYGFVFDMPVPSGWSASQWQLQPSLSGNGTTVVTKMGSSPSELPSFYSVDWDVAPLARPYWFQNATDSIVVLDGTGMTAGKGQDPWVTIEGKPIRLNKLAIAGSSPTKLSSLGLQLIEPVHMTENGVLTAKAVQSGANVVIQLIPVTDSDDDDIADDYEIAYADWLNDTYGLNVSANVQSFNGSTDYAGTGETASNEFTQGKSAPNRLSETEGGVTLAKTSIIGGNSTLFDPVEWGSPKNYYSDASYVGVLDENRTGSNSTTVSSETQEATAKYSKTGEINKQKGSVDVEWEKKITSISITKNSTVSVVDQSELQTGDVVKTETSISYTAENPSSMFVQVDASVTETRKEAPPVTYTSHPSHLIWGVPSPAVLESPTGPIPSLPYVSNPKTSYEREPDGQHPKHETLEISNPTSWRVLAKEAFDAAKANASQYADISTETGSSNLGITGGLGEYEGPEFYGRPKARWEKGTWTIKGGETASTYILTTIKTPKLPEGTTEMIPSVIVSHEVIAVPAKSTKTISRETTPGTNEEWVDYNLWKAEGSIRADLNGDGVLGVGMDGVDHDKTTAQRPFRFWLNNDQDDVEEDEKAVPTGSVDGDDLILKTDRDIEDFCPLALRTLPIFETELAEGRLTAKLKFESTQGIVPYIRIWNAGQFSTDFNSNPAAGKSAFTRIGLVSSYASVDIPKEIWASPNFGRVAFEGVSPGAGRLVLVVSDGYTDCEVASAYISIQDVRTLYRRAKVNVESKDIPDPSSAPPPSYGWVWDPYGFNPNFEPLQDKTCVYVHGWRMPYNLTVNWASTSYKRLWHQGYRGRFYSFRWPTLSSDTNFAPDWIDDWTEAKSPIPPASLGTYNESEYKAWLCGSTLADFVNKLPNDGERRLFAHSMGNVISGAAFRWGMNVKYYALCNPAMSVMAYDTDPSFHEALMALKPTPDTDSDSLFRATYGLNDKFASIGSAKSINFCLPQDESMPTWFKNTLLFKPQPSIDLSELYWYNPLATWTNKMNYGNPPSRSVSSLSEAMGFVVASKTKSAGEKLATAGVIDERVDMGTYGFGDMHSAQWRLSLKRTRSFWRELVFQLDLEP